MGYKFFKGGGSRQLPEHIIQVLSGEQAVRNRLQDM